MHVCTRGFGYLFCWPRGRGIGLVCTRRFLFHEFYNFLLFNFLIFIFLEDIFLPTTFTHTHDPRPLPTTHDPRHLATLFCEFHVKRYRQRKTKSNPIKQNLYHSTWYADVLFHFSGAVHVPTACRESVASYGPKVVSSSHRKDPICNCVHSYSITPCHTPFKKKKRLCNDYKAVVSHRTNKYGVQTGPVPTFVPEYKVSTLYRGTRTVLEF